MTIEIVVTLDLDPALVAQIEAVDNSLHVRVLGRGMRASFHERTPYPSELQALTSSDDIEANLPEADILFASWAGALPGLDLPALAPRLRWVQLTHAGAERVDATLTRGVTFTTVGGMSAGPIAEWVIGCMLMFAKGWPATFRDQQQHVYRRFMPRELAGSTVGIVGLGTIGLEVASRARALGCRVMAMRRSFTARAPHDLVDEAVPPGDLDYLLSASDYVVLTAPLTAETRRLIDARAIRAMRSDAVLINVSRGGLVDEDALVEALRKGTIGGTALDVFQREPLPPDSPLWDLDRAILSPHIAAGTEHYYERATDVFCANLAHYLRGESLAHVVDVERGY
jgi:phosphoglycerate dehydrogenase-like enzyme